MRAGISLVARSAVLALGTFAAAAAPAAAPVYRIEALDKQHHIRPQAALGISNNGIVTGSGWMRSRYSGSAYLYKDGTTRPLWAPDTWAAAGWSVNVEGAVAGRVGAEAWTWDKSGAGTNLDALVPCDVGSDRSSTATGINDVGDVALSFICDRGGVRVFGAYLYRAGSLIELGTLGGNYTWASGINNVGQITGNSFLPPDGDGEVRGHAFIWKDGHMRDIGTLGGPGSGAQDINDAGHVVGMSTNAADENRGYWYDGSTMHQLPSCDGEGNWPQPKAINNHDQITGNFFRKGFEAFLYEKGRCRLLLNLLDGSGAGWTSLQADDINDHGVIVGSGLFNGKGHAFIATPVRP
jgi:probable HAF family extracellular repeat protein